MGERGLVFLLLTHTPLSTEGSVARRRALRNVNPPRGPLYWRTNTTKAWSERLCTGTFDDITPLVPAPAHSAAVA